MLLSNLSGPTHPNHRRAVIGGFLHPQPWGGRGGGGQLAGSLNLETVWKAVPRKTASGAQKRRGRERARVLGRPSRAKECGFRSPSSFFHLLLVLLGGAGVVSPRTRVVP